MIIVSAISLLLGFLVVQDQAASVPLALDPALRSHLRSESLALVTHVADLPPTVQVALKSLFKDQSLDMAEPGEDFQATDVVLGEKLPSRRLITAGCSRDHCLVHYERGGVGHTYNVVLVAVTR